MKRISALTAAGLLVLLPTASGPATPQPVSQLETVRSSIRALERRLAELAAESADAAQEKERLNAELELAQARVHENELTLRQSQIEVEQARDEVARLAEQMARRREVLRRHLELVTLLGRPGPVQLMFDVAGKGDLERAVATVALLTTGQVRLFEEYRDLRARHATRLAALSQIVEGAQHEARQLAERRRDLERTQGRVEARLSQLRRSQTDAGLQLADLREREQALQRLMTRLASRDRFTGQEDIRRYRGALPWPTDGTVVRSFGRRYLPKYATYTVCNGLRFAADPGSPVRAIFPGVVAFARHFKGYGNMVVVDHGREVYSLVAGLATIHVRLDQRVTMGRQLGLSAPPKSDGNLYFEIRAGGDPQDPRRWLQLEEGK